MDHSNRIILSKRHNEYLANGVERHKPTSVAPPSLLEPFTDSLLQKIEEHHRIIDAQLRKSIGTPFFSEPGFILYHGDSTELLRKLAVKRFQVDLTLTSPPYNIGKEYERIKPVDDYVRWCASWMETIYNITTPTGAFWLNLGYFEVPGKGLCVPIPYLLWDKSRFYLLQEVVWKYGAGVTTKRRLSPRNEKWLFFVKNPNKYTFNLDDIRDPNVKYPNQKKKGKFRCHPLGKNPSDVWEFPKVTTGKKRSSKERTDHPAQFPLGVVERIIKASSNQTQIVLDPFAGSCSAGIASYGLGRIFIGFEIKQEYCEMSVRRFEHFKKERKYAQAQRSLF